MKTIIIHDLFGMCFDIKSPRNILRDTQLNLARFASFGIFFTKHFWILLSDSVESLVPIATVSIN